MIKQRVSAFTILEVTVTMLITAVIIGITFTSFAIIFKYYNSVSKKNDEMMVLITLDHLLKRDFDRADTIIKDTKGVSFLINSKLVKYEFSDEGVVRKGAAIDSFKEAILDVEMDFENTPVNVLKTTGEQNRIDELSFKINYRQQEIPCHYKKLYSSENLIQRNSDAIN